jgi:elongator complex protein 1
MVAQKSQKDPKEYLPYLSELQKLPVFLQRFKIDRDLGRWERALFNLSQVERERNKERKRREDRKR